MNHLISISALTTFSSWLLLLKGEIIKAPVKNPQKILDLGTGTGIWAIDAAE
jgi:ribosomal protein L11 methylase PrmA